VPPTHVPRPSPGADSASTSTGPELLTWAPEATAASILAVLWMSVIAMAPLKPPIETFRISADAVATFSPSALTVTLVECSILPPRLAVVSPKISAIGIMMSTAMPPSVRPGAVAVA